MRKFVWISAASVLAGGAVWYELNCGEDAMAQEREPAPACCATDSAADEPAIACTIGDPAVMQERKTETERLFGHAQEIVETDGGYALKFNCKLAEDLFSYARFESECCAFIEFSLRFERDHGPVWLELSGSPEAKEVIAAMLPTLPAIATRQE